VQQDNELLKKTVEENQKGIVVLETVREEANCVNEELRDVQKRFFCLLNEIQINRERSS
jgi:hypothetical protein